MFQLMVNLVLLLGLASLVGGLILIARRSPRYGRSHCPACGYSLAGLPGEVPCPECGTSATDMERRRTCWVTRREVMVGPAILCLIVFVISMAIGLWPASGPLFIELVLGAFPFGALSLSLLTVSRRLTPIAAGTVAAVSLAAFAPLLTFLFYQTSLVLDKDALNGLGYFFASMGSVPVCGFGLLVGALIVQHPRFKRLPAASRNSIADDSKRPGPAL